MLEYFSTLLRSNPIETPFYLANLKGPKVLDLVGLTQSAALPTLDLEIDRAESKGMPERLSGFSPQYDTIITPHILDPKKMVNTLSVGERVKIWAKVLNPGGRLLTKMYVGQQYGYLPNGEIVYDPRNIPACEILPIAEISFYVLVRGKWLPTTRDVASRVKFGDKALACVKYIKQRDITPNDEHKWKYLEQPQYFARHRLISSYLDDLDLVVEIGGGRTSMANWVKCSHINIDPIIGRYDSLFQFELPKCDKYAIVCLGLSCTFRNKALEASWLGKLGILAEKAQYVILECAEGFEKGRNLLSKISDMVREQGMVIELDVSLTLHGIPPRNNIRFVRVLKNSPKHD